MKIYQYLAKPPITDMAAIEEQLRLSVNYQRTLTQIEIDRRKAVDALYQEALPAEHAAVAEAERAAEAAVLALRAARSTQAVKSEPGDEDAREEVKLAKAALLAARGPQKAAWEALKVARKSLTPTIKDRLKALDAQSFAEKKQAYNAPVFERLAWGTKLQVGEAVERAAKMSAMEGTLPKMPTYDGSGGLAVQIQGGMSPEDAASDTRFRLEVVDAVTWRAKCQEGRRRRIEAQVADGLVRRVLSGDGVIGNDGRPLPPPKDDGLGAYAIAHIRIGSDGRAPIWASWPVRISRPLPKNGVIKWARMQAVKIGTRTDWRLQVTVDAPAAAPKDSGGGTLAVNLGWRNLPDDAPGGAGIRVAYAVGTDGYEEEVRVPERFISKAAHADRIRATRDTICDAAHKALQEWVNDRDEDLPEWFIEATRYMVNWRGPKQLARLVREWEGRRFAGDERMFLALSTWRNGKTAEGHSVGNHHLRFWEMDEREKVHRHRNEIYLQIARKWAAKYDRIVVTDMDLRDFAEEPLPEEGKRTKGQAQRRTRTLAGPSLLRAAIKGACANTGTTFEEKKTAAPTQTCSRCAAVERFDARRSLVKTCSACGHADDQDRNHCRVLLIASSGVVRDRGGSLASSVAQGSEGGATEKKGRWGKRRSQKGVQVAESAGV